MTVAELIEGLKTIENQGAEVVYPSGAGNSATVRGGLAMRLSGSDVLLLSSTRSNGQPNSF